MVHELTYRMRRAVEAGAVAAGGLRTALAHAGSDGPYRIIGDNFTDRSIYRFRIDGFGAGNLRAHRRIDARWAAVPTDPRNPNTTSNASSATN